MPEQSFVRVEGLEHRYANVQALWNVGFELAAGEVLGLLGVNGAGKTTTLKILSGVLRPSRGRVQVDGVDLQHSPRQFKARLGYLPDVPPLYPELRVEEYLRHCARLRGVPHRKLETQVGETMERCGLEAERRRLIGALSKGYQQRVGIAQAVVHRPALLVLDEPTVGLDPLQMRDIRALVMDLTDMHSVVLSSHILSEVQAMCDRVQVIDRGRSVLDHSLTASQAACKRLRIAFSNPPAPSELEALERVQQVEVLTGGAFLLSHPDTTELTPRLVETSVARGWGLTALGSERTDLEQVFLSIVTQSGEPQQP